MLFSSHSNEKDFKATFSVAKLQTKFYPKPLRSVVVSDVFMHFDDSSFETQDGKVFQ